MAYAWFARYLRRIVMCDMGIALHNFMSSGHCFCEKTSNGCKDEHDVFTRNSYDFYELCRAGERKGAEFHIARKHR